jgi:hypothetical protein
MRDSLAGLDTGLCDFYPNPKSLRGAEQAGDNGHALPSRVSFHAAESRAKSNTVRQ